jgi:hypothetical protein
MKIYQQNEWHPDYGCIRHWCSSKKGCARARAATRRRGNAPGDTFEHDITLNKSGILWFLNQHATHDNG